MKTGYDELVAAQVDGNRNATKTTVTLHFPTKVKQTGDKEIEIEAVGAAMEMFHEDFIKEVMAEMGTIRGRQLLEAKAKEIALRIYLEAVHA